MTHSANPLMSTLFAVTTAVLFTASNADAAHPQYGVPWLAGEIRGQIAEVQARADSVLPFCDDADDVREELARLCRDLDKFERRLARGIHSRHDLDKLARLADKVHEHACEVKEELAEALEDLRDDRRHARRAFHHEVARPGSPVYGYHEAFVQPRRRASFRLSFGRGGPRFSVVSNNSVHAPLPHAPLPYNPVAAPGPVLTAPQIDAGVPWGEVRGLTRSVDRLHFLTKQLYATLCG